MKFLKGSAITVGILFFFSIMASILSTPDPIDMRLRNDIGVNELQASKLKSILNEVGIYDYKTIIHDPLFDNVYGKNDKTYRLNTDDFKNVLITVCDDVVFFKVKYNGIVLYDNDTFKSKIINTVLTDEKERTLKTNTMNDISTVLIHPEHTTFLDSWKYGLIDGEDVIQGKIKTPNKNGEMIELEFQTKYKSGALISLIIGEQEYIKK